MGLIDPQFGTNLACFLPHSEAAKSLVFRSYVVPESTVLFLLGGGLIVLAALVRRFGTWGGTAAPKSLQVMLWISPEEIAEQLSAGRRAAGQLPAGQLSAGND